MNQKKISNMTQEEAISRIKAWNLDSDDMEVLAVVIPELAESEDERILRVISEAVITFFSDYANDFEDEDRDAALAWLEKQKEQKPVSISCGHENDAEWSEADEKMRDRLITRLNWITYNTRTDGTSPNITFFDEIDWLKSLCPSWKPSEEQQSGSSALKAEGTNE